MRYKVRIEGRTFEVEVGNVDARPVVVMIEGERYEVWPELLAAEVGPPVGGAPGAAMQPAADIQRGGEVRAAAPARAGAPTPAEEAARTRRTRRTTGAAAAPAGTAGKMVYAPIPGVVDSVAVRAGDEVSVGDPLCVVEAMKMKNVIRATRAGTVADVFVAAGQHVKHNDPLVEFGN